MKTHRLESGGFFVVDKAFGDTVFAFEPPGEHSAP
jgi:hypothetical protein